MGSVDRVSGRRDRRRLWGSLALAGIGVAGAAFTTWHVLLRIPEPAEVCDALWRSTERRGDEPPGWARGAVGPQGQVRWVSRCLEVLEGEHLGSTPALPSQISAIDDYSALARCVGSASNDARIDECLQHRLGRALAMSWAPEEFETPSEPSRSRPPLSAEPIEVVDVVRLDAPYYEARSLRSTRTLVTGRSLGLAPVHDLPAHRALVQIDDAPRDQLHTVLYDTRTGAELAHFGRVVLVQRRQRIAEIRERGTGRPGLLELDTDRIVYPDPVLADGTEPSAIRLALFDGPVTWGVIFGRDAAGAVFHATWPLGGELPSVLAAPFPYWPEERTSAGTFEIRPEAGPRPRRCHAVHFRPDQTTVCDDRHASLVDGTAVYAGGRIGPSRAQARCIGECLPHGDRGRVDSTHWFGGQRFVNSVTTGQSGPHVHYLWAPRRVVRWERSASFGAFATVLSEGLLDPSLDAPTATSEWVDLRGLRLLSTEPLVPVGWSPERPRRTLVVRPGEDHSMLVLDSERAVLEPVVPDLDCPQLRPIATSESYGAFRCDSHDGTLTSSRLVDHRRRRVLTTRFATQLEMDSAGCVVAASPRRVVVDCPTDG